MTRFAGIVLTLAMTLAACSGGDEGERPAKKKLRRADGEPVVVTASVDKATVDIGDRVRYSVEVRYDPDYDVDFPPVLDQFANQVLHDTGTWTVGRDRGTRKVKRIELVLDPGLGPVLTIPATRIRYREDEEAEWQEAVTEEITVEVVSVAEGAPEFREPLDLFDIPEEEKAEEATSPWMILGGVAGFLALLAVVSYFVLRKKRAAPEPVVPPHELAQRELAHLTSLGLLEKGAVREYYYRLTDILRRYIELRFGIMAPEQTTEEFLAAMRGHEALPTEQKGVLEEFLAAADMVKYARHSPPTEEARGAWDVAERFVKITISTEAAPAPKEATHAV